MRDEVLSTTFQQMLLTRLVFESSRLNSPRLHQYKNYVEKSVG